MGNIYSTILTSMEESDKFGSCDSISTDKKENENSAGLTNDNAESSGTDSSSGDKEAAWSGLGGAKCTLGDIAKGTNATNNLTDTTGSFSVLGQVADSVRMLGKGSESGVRYDCAAPYITGPFSESTDSGSQTEEKK